MNRQYLRGAAIGTLFLAIVAVCPVKVPTADQSGVPLPGVPTVAPASTAANTPAIHPIGGLYSGITAQQQFPANGARVRSIALFLGTYLRENHGVLKVTVQADAAGIWQDVATRTVDKAAIKDNAYQTFDFSPAVTVRKGQALRILVTADGDANNAVTWWVNGSVQPEGYSLVYNGMPQEGTARFIVSYATASGPLFTVIGPFWQRITVFLDPLWQIVLVFGLCVLAGSLVLLGRYLIE
ncbi:MAG: hypothetical protein M3008_02810 [Chloroflexota bacterium]|nr:hypothetical protein [Chloroflexota bacterium]